MSEEDKLPQHWQVKRLEDITSVLGDGLHGTPKYCEDGEYYFINGNNLADGKIEIKGNTKRVSVLEYEKYKKPLNEKTVFISINGTLGYTAFYNNEKIILGKSACYFNVLESIEKKYVRYFLTSNQFISYANRNATGSTIKNVGLKSMRELEIPLPPLPEQQAIVSKIEELLSDLENGKQQLLLAQQQLKIYRQSLLKWAFEGKLTNKNVKDGELPIGWEIGTIGEFFHVFIGSTPKRNISSYWGGDINWISSGEIAFCNIKKTKEKITSEGLANTSCKVHPIGTVIIAMIGEGKTRGQAAILKIEASHNQNTAAIRVDNKIYKSELLYYYLVLKYEDNRRIGSGNNQKALNKERVKSIEIPMIPLKEQQLIVDELESKLTVCDKIEETISQSLLQAESLRQSILKKAFEGKLHLNHLKEQELSLAAEPEIDYRKK